MSHHHARGWVFDEKNLRDDVSLILKDTDYKLRVFKIVSGDSGQTYWIQLLNRDNKDGGKPYTQIVLCDCPVGKFVQPVEALGLGEELRCKHVKNLLAFLES